MRLRRPNATAGRRHLERELLALAHAQNESPNVGTFVPATFLRVSVTA
jgi:hypothetical protein